MVPFTYTLTKKYYVLQNTFILIFLESVICSLVTNTSLQIDKYRKPISSDTKDGADAVYLGAWFLFRRQEGVVSVWSGYVLSELYFHVDYESTFRVVYDKTLVTF